MKKTITTNNNTENIAAMATLPPLPTDVLLWNDYQFPREINNNDISEDNTPTISGKGEPGMTAVIDLGDGQSVRVPVNAEGNWSWTPAPALADGTYTWSVALEDAAGNRGESTTPVTFIVDTVGNAVSISHAEDNTGTLTNPLASGSSTDDVNPVIVGTATPGSLVTLYVDGKAVGSMMADPATGEWAIEINPALESGKTYEITAGEYSGPGEIPPPTRPFLLTIDTVVPTGTFDRVSDDVGRYQGDLPNPAVTDDTTPTLHGTGRPGDVVFVRNGSEIIGSASVGADGRWEYTLPEQTNGTALDMNVVFRGPTGVESAPTDPWKLVIDIEAPNKPIIGDVEDDVGPVVGPIHNGDTTDDTQPVFSGEGAVPGETVELIVDDEVVGTAIVGEDGKWEVTPENPLAEGEHEAVVVITDPAGNSSEPSDPIEFIVDLTPPEKPVIGEVEDDVGPVTGPIHNGDTTDDTLPVFRGEGAEPGEAVELIIDDKVVGTAIVGEDGKWEVTPENPLAEGKHEAVVVITDPAGNASEPSDPIEFIVDLTPPEKPVIGEVEDDVGPVVGPINNGDTTDDTLPVFRGEGAEPGEAVELIIDDKVVGTAIVGEDGKWEVTPENPLAEGKHEAVVVITDPAGNASEPSDPIEFIVDLTPPEKPVIGEVEDDVGPITGPIHNGDTTDDTLPVFRGEGAEPGETVELIIDDEVVGTAIVGEDGKWEATPENPLAEGKHEAVVVITDPAGNASEPSDPIEFIVDLTPPVKPTIDTVFDDAGQQTGYLNNGDITDDSTPTFAGSAEKNSLVYIIVNGVQVDSVRATDAGTWTWTPPLGLANGHYDVKVVAEDKAGLRSEPSNEFSFDLLAGGIPTAPAITDVIDDVESHVGTVQNGDITNDDRPTITGTAQDGTIVYLYDGANPDPIGSAVVTGGRWTIDFDTPLAQGEHRFRAVAEDVTGNRSPETGEWVIIVDSVAPDAATDIELWDDFGTPGPIHNDDTTDDNTPTYRGKGEAGGTAIIDLGDGTTVRVPIDASGNWSYTPAPALADGDYTWKVSIEDKAGNVGPASDPIHFIVDTSGNGVSISHVVDDEGAITGNLGSGSHTDDTTPTVVGHATPGALVKVYVDGKYVDSVRADAVTGNWQLTIAPALGADGTYQITATEDPGTGESAPTPPFELTLDTSIPTGSLDRVVDDVGLVQGDLANPAVTDDTTPTLHGTGRAGDTVFIYDGTTLVNSVTVGIDGTWNYTLPPQNNGTELSLSAVFQSPTGVKSAPTAPWDLTIDTDAPTAPTITGMYDDAGTLIADGGRSRDTTPELRGTAEKNSLVTIYSSDGKNPIASVYADASGNWTWTSPKLTDANHDFYVTSQDAAGNVSGESNHYGLEVDTQTATPIILGAYDDVEGGVYKALVPNGGLSNDANMELRGTAEANSIVYIYNAYNNAVIDTVRADANGNWTWERAVANTAAGRPHMFYTIAKDDLGNVSGKSETYSLNVDTVNNAPVISGAYDDVTGGVYNGLVGNGGVTNDRTPELRGTAEAGSVVYIVIDNYGTVAGSVTAGADGKWSFPMTTNYNQTYNFHAYSIDKAGNRSVDSSKFALTIDTVNNAPVISGAYDNVAGGVYNGLVGNGGLTNDRTPELRGTAEAGSVVYIINPATGGVYGSVTAGANGAWSFTVTTNYNQLYNFQAYSIDKAGNRSVNSSNFGITIDGTNAAPVITSVTDNVGPVTGNVANAGSTDDNTPTLNGTAEAGSTVYVAINGTTYSTTAAANGSWSVTPSALPLGNHTFSVFSIDKAGNQSTGVSRSLTVVSPKTSGFEDFNAVPFQNYGKGLVTLASGLKFTLNDKYYPGYGAAIYQWGAANSRKLALTGDITMHFDGVNSVSMKLSGANDSVQSSVVKSTYTVYDTLGKVISSGLLPSGEATFSVTAPAGREIGNIVFSMGRGASSGLSGGGNTINTDQYMIDDVRWTVNTSRSASRSMMMNTEEQHDDNSHIVSTLNDREINLDYLQNKTIDITNSKQDKLNISLNDVLTHAEKDMFIADGNKQLMVQGDKGDVLNLNDLLPDNSDPGNWTNAGNVKVSGVEYQVFHMESQDVELLVQAGVTVNVNNH